MNHQQQFDMLIPNHLHSYKYKYQLKNNMLHTCSALLILCSGYVKIAAGDDTMLGAVMRDLRNKKNLSLKNVNDAINITDSRLSKFENGDLDILSFKEILELTKLYDSSLI